MQNFRDHTSRAYLGAEKKHPFLQKGQVFPDQGQKDVRNQKGINTKDQIQENSRNFTEKSHLKQLRRKKVFLIQRLAKHLFQKNQESLV